MKKTSDYRVVILKCPYANWENKDTREYYQQMITVKLRGYVPRYGFGVLPVDGTDLFSDHLLIGKELSDGTIQIMAGLKSFQYSLADIFSVEFTPVAFLKKFQHLDHLEIIQKQIHCCVNEGKGIEYSGSFTIDPCLKGNQEQTKEVLEVMSSVILRHFEEQNISESIAIGTPKYHTDKVLREMGYDSISKNSSRLPNVTLPNFMDMEVTIMHLSQFSASANRYAKKYQNLWDDRKEIGRSALQVYHETLKRERAA